MKSFILAAALAAGAATSAFAGTDIQSKVMSDAPGINERGATAMPTAKPQSGSLTDKAMRDLPGNTGMGRTLMPTAQPLTGSLSDKARADRAGS